MNELKMDEILMWWSLKSTSPHATKKRKTILSRQIR